MPPERNAGTAIDLAGVSKRFAAEPVLDQVAFEIAPGELVGLLGPSGSGKTTLLRIIAGLEFADQGTVKFAGVDAATLSVQQRRVGFVFQHYALFKHMRVFDNIAYGLQVRRRAERPSKREIATRVADLLDLVQLPGLESRYPAQLSGGQRQRVALARALAIEPRVLLLDEPFGALDAKVRRDLRRWLRDLHDRTGLTTIFVTHDQDEAMEIADRVVVLDKGRVEQIGTPAELYERPASPFVMSFIGDALALAISVSGGCISVGGKAIAVDAAELNDGLGRLYLRPQDVALRRFEPGMLPVRILRKRHASQGPRFELAVGDTQMLEVDGGGIGDDSFNQGDEVGLSFLRRPMILPAN